MKNNDPKIVSISYSINLGKEVYNKCWQADMINLPPQLAEKLKNAIPEITKTCYPVNFVHTIRIKFDTDSIKKVDPKYNNKLWQKIASIINEHIKEE